MAGMLSMVYSMVLEFLRYVIIEDLYFALDGTTFRGCFQVRITSQSLH